MKKLSIPSLAIALALSLSSAWAQERASILPAAEAAGNIGEFKKDANGRVSEDQIKELLRIVTEKDVENSKKRRDYTYIQQTREDELDGKGNVKSTKTTTSEVLMIYDEQVERLLARNDKPPSEKEAAKEEERIQKILDKRKDESDAERSKRLAKAEKRDEQGRSFVLEVADAYNFQMAGIEQLQGRDAYVIDAEPRPGYKPRLKEAKLLPKIRFRAWIDKADRQWAKLEAECIDTITFGWFLARIHKGTRVVVEQTRVNDEVWLPKHVAARVDARVALLKKFNVNEDFTYSEYRKFRSDTRIVGAQEVPR